MSDEQPAWLQRFREGDFSALPSTFRWSASVEVAHLIDGYELVGSSERLSELSNSVMEQLRAGREGTVSAFDLWVTLFYQHRGYRHQGYPPGKAEQVVLNRLCRQLRSALSTIDLAQRLRLIEAMANVRRTEEPGRVA